MINNLSQRHRAHRGHGGKKVNENEIGSLIVDTAVYLHKNLGPGLLR